MWSRHTSSLLGCVYARWLADCGYNMHCVCMRVRKKKTQHRITHSHTRNRSSKNMPNQNQYQKNDDDERETQKKMNFIDGMNVGVDDSVTLCLFCLCLCLSLSRSYTLSFSSFFTSKCNVFNQKNHFNKFTFIITIIQLSVSARERTHTHGKHEPQRHSFPSTSKFACLKN